jgi:hypothetical protein
VPPLRPRSATPGGVDSLELIREDLAVMARGPQQPESINIGEVYFYRLYLATNNFIDSRIRRFFEFKHSCHR